MSEQPYDAEQWWAGQKHQYVPSKIEDACLHRLDDGAICGSREPEAFIHQPPHAKDFQ